MACRLYWNKNERCNSGGANSVGFVSIWKENILKDLENKILEYITIEEFFINMKK